MSVFIKIGVGACFKDLNLFGFILNNYKEKITFLCCIPWGWWVWVISISVYICQLWNDICPTFAKVSECEVDASDKNLMQLETLFCSKIKNILVVDIWRKSEIFHQHKIAWVTKWA